jgi:SWIM zinc finger domain-containing protein
MGIISLASGDSCYKGLEYYKNKKVISLNKINENVYESVVEGNNNYKVHLDINHPKKSTCDCPLAKGRKIICKHIVATYFMSFPK